MEQRPVECCWTAERFWTLLEATDKAFPCVLRQHDSKITMEGLTALCYAGGRAIILRSKYVELIHGCGWVQDWAWNLKTQSLNTLTDCTNGGYFLNSYISPTFGFRLGRNFSPR